MGWGPDCTPGRPPCVPLPFPPASAANTTPDPAWAEQRAERLPGQPEPWVVRVGRRAGWQAGRKSTESSSRLPPRLSEVPGSSLCWQHRSRLQATAVAITHRSGLATPTSCTAAELEVSGLRRGWAGFQERRLSLATKTESRPARETGGKKKRQQQGEERLRKP